MIVHSSKISVKYPYALGITDINYIGLGRFTMSCFFAKGFGNEITYFNVYFEFVDGCLHCYNTDITGHLIH